MPIKNLQSNQALRELCGVAPVVNTSESVRLTLDYPPTLNHLYATVKGRRVLTKTGRLYKAKVAQLTQKPLEGTLRVFLDAYRPRKAGDIDNTLKVVFDSLTGVIWRDDSQVVELHARRFDCPKNPRVEVTIERAEGVSE